MKILAKFRGKSDLQEMDLFDTDRTPLDWPSAPAGSSGSGGGPIPFDMWAALTSDNINPVWEPAQSGDYPFPAFMTVDQYGEIGTTQRCYLDGVLYVHGTPTADDPSVGLNINDNWPSPEVEMGPGLSLDTPIARLIPVKVLFEVSSLLSINIGDMSFDFSSDRDAVHLYGVIWALSDPVA